MDYCDVFINCLDSHSDGTHSLKKIHSQIIKADKNNTIMYVMLFFPKFVPMKKQSHLHLGCFFFFGEIFL